MAPTLAYWPIRGNVQQIRLLLRYIGMEFEDKHYAFGPAPTYDKRNWFAVKHDMGLDFPILPYYIDGEVRLSQPLVVMRYIARKHNLVGKTEEEITRIDQIVTELEQLKSSFISLIYSPQFKDKRADFEATLPPKLKEISDFLDKRPYFAGNEITYADFVVYEFLDVLRIFKPTCLDDYQNLKDFMNRFEALPAIKQYLASPECIRYPVTGKIAFWGN